MDPFAALRTHFGDRLSLDRDGSRARWSYDGLAAIVEFVDGAIRATFSDRPTVDRATAQVCYSVYRPIGAPYETSAAGSERLARDVADFFLGVREPRFAFAEIVA